MNNSVYIIIPCLNAAETISLTIESVLEQKTDFKLYCHVQDGLSSDGTPEIIKSYAENIKSKPIEWPNVFFTWDSSPDRGLYHAISKAADNLAIPQDSFMTWINADDLLYSGALSALEKLSQAIPSIMWAGGLARMEDLSGKLLSEGQPGLYPRYFLQHGLCDGVHWFFLQQEGTFWKKKLWDLAGGLNPDLKLAGDWDLWRRMAGYADYVQLARPMGVFRKREGQLSQNLAAYCKEVAGIVPIQTRREALRAIMGSLDSLSTPTVFFDGGDITRITGIKLPLTLKGKFRMLLVAAGFYKTARLCLSLSEFLKKLVRLFFKGQIVLLKKCLMAFKTSIHR